MKTTDEIISKFITEEKIAFKSEDEEINIYNKLVDIFSRIDPAVLNSEENRWNEIIEPLMYSSELF